jgi:hypothetical protein
MTFVKRIAQSEKAVKTTAAADDLVARRKARYKGHYEICATKDVRRCSKT